jgi:hypothetical protein
MGSGWVGRQAGTQKCLVGTPEVCKKKKPDRSFGIAKASIQSSYIKATFFFITRHLIPKIQTKSKPNLQADFTESLFAGFHFLQSGIVEFGSPRFAATMPLL